MRVDALVNSAARETLERDYQYLRPCLFDSTAFEATFNTAPTPSEHGVAAALAHLRATS